LGEKPIIKNLKVVALLVLLLVSSSAFASLSTLQANSTSSVSAQVNANTTPNYGNLSQYVWPEFQGDSSFSRFSAGPAPATSNVLWKTNITGLQPYIVAFDGMIFVCTNTSVVALGQTGPIVWNTTIPMPGTWPIAYEIDDSHMVVESTCLDPETGNILWTSSTFCADTGPLFAANVYSPEEQMFYTKVGSSIEAWNFSDPSISPTLAWSTYVPGGGIDSSGTTYGDGMVFPGSFLNQQMALNATTGAVLWNTPTKGPMIFSGSYYNGRFLRGGTDDNTMYCFNATNGQILWTYTPDTNGYFCVGCAVAYGMVYETNKDGNLYAINVETGNLVWKYQGPGPILFPGNPTVADGMVYATTGQDAQYLGLIDHSQFACLNAYTGKPIWTLPIEALAPRESVAIAYGILYMIPGDVTKAVDSISGKEYATLNQLWAIGPSSTTTPSATPTPTSTPISTPTPTPVPTPTYAPVKTSITSNWPIWGNDPAHSSTAQVGPSNLTLGWKFTTGGAVISSPTVADGIVYVGSSDHNIYAIGALNGSLIWKFTTQDVVESSPAEANGKVYTGGDDGYVYCLNAYTGALIWKTFVNSDLPFTYENLVLKSSPTVSGGNVYIGSLDGYLYALDANNGNIVWQTKTNGPIECSPAVSDGAVYFTSQEPTAGALYKLDANTGAVIWTLPLPYEYQYVGGDEMLGSPSVADGMVFASANLRNYYGINANTGDIVWNYSDPAAIEFIYCSPIYVNGELFIIDKFNIVCLNATNGHTFWSFFTGDELYTSPTYADGKIYDASSQRDVFILNANNKGAKIATYKTPSSSWSSPTIANGLLYVGCNDWNVYCLSNNITNQTSPSTSSNNVTLEHGLLVLIAIIAVVVIVVVALIGATNRKSRKK
jgi:outer membrane protein assembly factor BamB